MFSRKKVTIIPIEITVVKMDLTHVGEMPKKLPVKLQLPKGEEVWMHYDQIRQAARSWAAREFGLCATDIRTDIEDGFIEIFYEPMG